MTEQTIQDLLEYMLTETDKFALVTLSPGTPEYHLQQGMIKNAARFRLSLKEHPGNKGNE